MIAPILRRLSRGIRVARVVERAVRWSFVALLFIGAHLLTSKFLGWPVPSEMLPAFLLIPLVAVVLEAIRPFPVRDCAIRLDRELRLDERISTALEAGGVMAAPLEKDAEKFLRSADARSIGRIHWPKETPFFAISGLVVLALSVIPAPERLRRADPALQSSAREERRKVLAAADTAEQSGDRATARELGDIAALLDKGTPEAIREALSRLRAVEERSSAKLMTGSLTDEQKAALEKIIELASGSGSALGRALAKSGDPAGTDAPSPSLVKKIGLESGSHSSDRPSRFVVKELSSGGAPEIAARETVARRLERRDWPARCDAAVRKYFSE